MRAVAVDPVEAATESAARFLSSAAGSAGNITSVELMERLGMDPDPWQLDVLSDPPSRLLMMVSRQGGKSTVGAGLALDTALGEPGSLTLLLSRSQRQSGELLRKVGHLLDHHPDPPRVRYESTLQLEFDTGSRILSLPGKESTIRSYSGVRLLILDEAARIEDDLYHSVRPMIAVSEGDIVALTTPWGKRGWFHKAWTEGPDLREDPERGWKKVMVTADEIPRITDETIAEERRATDDKWVRQEFYCSFEDMEGSVFSADEVDAMFEEPVDFYGAA